LFAYHVGGKYVTTNKFELAENMTIFVIPMILYQCWITKPLFVIVMRSLGFEINRN